ncbi:MAG: site-specific DNA-methyltransferase [Oceanospirillaceae bacterium]|nr:site-specific DNA-methyltransferase [Oceanospirillaceae bacterium]
MGYTHCCAPVPSVVYNEDCIEGLKRFSDNYFDLAIVDPPYGINASKGTWGSSNKGKVTNYGKKDWDKQTPEQDYFLELRRVSKNQIVWGANHFISRMPFDSSCWLVWDKQNTGDFADCELAWCSFNTAVRKFVYRWNGMLQQNMKNNEIRIHPTQKPVALYEWILQNYASEGNLILDTHVGSGSSRIACDKGGFNFTGFEIDKDYWEAQEKRFSDYKRQLRLF